jgi:uncharacterized protein (DUF1697 family)
MRYVALLRAINLGKRQAKMDHLRTVFGEMGFKDVSTYVASGNVLFSSGVKDEAKLIKKIEAGLEGALRFDVPTILRNAEEMATAAARLPLDELRADPKLRMYVSYFRRIPTAAERKAVEALSTDLMEFTMHGRELHTLIRPPGDLVFAANYVEKPLGQTGTARNWKSTLKLAELLNG